MTLPFIAAAIEIQDLDERDNVIQKVDLYVDHFAPAVQKATKTFLSRVWHERDMHTHCSWFDSIHKPCAVLESIQGSLLD